MREVLLCLEAVATCNCACSVQAAPGASPCLSTGCLRFTHPQCVRSPTSDCFKGLDQQAKNYLSSVPLVGDLRSPAMRDRHWDALREATKVGGWKRSSRCAPNVQCTCTITCTAALHC